METDTANFPDALSTRSRNGLHGSFGWDVWHEPWVIAEAGSARLKRTVQLGPKSLREIAESLWEFGYMVQAGYAWVYKRYCDKPFCEYWLTLENEAMTDKLGLWQEPDPIPPWEWRKRK